MTQQAMSSQHLLSETELYMVYLEVARRDHDWRIRALYGEKQRPASHTPFRPLSESVFQQRRQAVANLLQGPLRFQQQLLRRAHYYRVDVQQLLAGKSKPAAPAAPILGLPLGTTPPLSSGNQTA
ncbi:hypothetical protein [Roseimaritima ulvae]|uniref:Uncharacterized protein n=1 Tax=Roseimaritima ulvae TaxID=980254 RepID=A0A5B9QN84_9BACT|nr:hypothetical protein [Roseimaritima ulvae]QEG38476.1 hypothetical protein UC8_04330 [Roseimaritima ulvae]